jgi:hypothetical protein
MAQIFIGRQSMHAEACGMGNESQFVNTLEDCMQKRGAPNMLISDSARVETSERVKALLRAYITKKTLP